MFMGPKNALEHTGLMLVSGPAERVATVRPVVEPMTGKLVHVGAGDERAAAFKLFGNSPSRSGSRRPTRMGSSPISS
jgi:3-hydroxyisobutyrate dehydrogenase